MKTTSELRLVATILFAVSTFGCKKATPFDRMTPIVDGTIMSRDPLQGLPSMLVLEDGATNDDCFPQRAYFTLGPDVMVFRNGSPKDTSELKVGRRVAVFGPGPTTQSCAPESPAKGIFLH